MWGRLRGCCCGIEEFIHCTRNCHFNSNLIYSFEKFVVCVNRRVLWLCCVLRDWWASANNVMCACGVCIIWLARYPVKNNRSLIDDMNAPFRHMRLEDSRMYASICGI